LLLLRMAWKLIPPLAGTMAKVDRDEIWRDLQATEARARSVSSQENNQTGRMDWNLARYGA
jgi:hypothetical protein